MAQLLLENEQIRLTFSAENGALTQVEDRARGFSHLESRAQERRALNLFDGDGGTLSRAWQFSGAYEDSCLRMRWTSEAEEARAEVRLLADGAAFRIHVTRRDDSPAVAVEYPILAGLTDRGDNTFLAHSWATGVLMQNPASMLPATGALRFAPYPECFSGLSMQLMTLYHTGEAGLYLAAHDGQGHQKWLNAYTLTAEEGAGLALSHMAGMEDLRPGAPIDMDYDFVLRLTPGLGWEDAAEMYREFALEQPWCARGPLAGRTDCARWLHDEVGYCTFGVNAGHDRSRWLRRYRQDIGQKGFHVLGPDWTNQPQTFGWGVPGGMEDWLPSRFSPETIRAIRDNGDYFAPFEFDFLVNLHQHQQEELKQALQRFPAKPMSHDAYAFNMLCPCEPFTRDFHREREVQLQRESGMDAIYYDISANNLMKVCTREDHHHTPGVGREITEGYREIYRDTQQALNDQAGRYIPMGTEQMCETFLDRLDFYQARAWGQPSSTLETWPILEHMRSGQARMIPLFDYVYHEYGAVRMDGWGKLVEETGALFFDTVAKTYLWGGLYEINHEYSPMEELDGVENTAEEHYFRFDPQHCAYSPERAAYLAAYAAARVGRANPYWAYGRMVRTPRMDIPMVKTDWYHYNHDRHNPTYKARGVIETPAVRTSAYQAPDGRFALFLAVPGAEKTTVRLPLRELAERYPDGQAALYELSCADPSPILDLGMLRCGEAEDQAFDLSPRGIYMLEIIQH